jgi:ribosome-binding factor A
MSLRQERLKKEFFRVIKEFFLYQVKNPMLKDISIEEVEVSRDLSYLKIYYVTKQKVDIKFERALERIIPVIKSSLPKYISLRKIPNMKFIYDNRGEYSRKINSILEKIEYSGQSVEELSQNYKNLDIEDL